MKICLKLLLLSTFIIPAISQADEHICLQSARNGIRYNLFLKPVANSEINRSRFEPVVGKLYTVSGVFYDGDLERGAQVIGTATKLKDVKGWYSFELTGQNITQNPQGGATMITYNYGIELPNKAVGKIGETTVFRTIINQDYDPRVLVRYGVELLSINCKEY